jgi:hypothetical protein
MDQDCAEVCVVKPAITFEAAKRGGGQILEHKAKQFQNIDILYLIGILEIP